MTDYEPNDIEDFFTKMDSEGGAYGSLQYGLRTEDYPDLPKEMRDDWNEIEDAFDDLDELRTAFFAKWEPASVHSG